ncbi:MAG: small subunit ribosomal protein S6 [Alphaproteobacteria bacterium]|jgi:small subunit ribosomal protein S6
MPFYENVFIARQDISSAQIESIADTMVALIEESGGRLARREYWGVRSLAYRMKKNKKGHYILLNFETPSATVQEMERQLRLNEDILRFMTIRTDDLPEEPSVVMASRSERTRYRDRPERNEDRAPRREASSAPEKAPEPAAENTPATASEGENA